MNRGETLILSKQGNGYILERAIELSITPLNY